MEAAVIDKIVGLTRPTREVIDGKVYSTIGALTLIKPPVAESIQVYTLTGLKDLIEASAEGVDPAQHLIHVISPTSVYVHSKASNDYSQRPVIIYGEILTGDRSYPFNKFVEQESAIIGLRSCFVKNDYPEDDTRHDDLDYVIKTITNLQIQDKLQVEDNGIAQNVTAKSEVAPAMTVLTNLKPRVKLAPYRTFREVEQPTSEFVLRVQKGQKGMPEVGLFEADGGAWKMDAIHNVRDWLKAQLKDWTIVA
jgi:hypothetical protein